jgi:hypothetical protein
MLVKSLGPVASLPGGLLGSWEPAWKPLWVLPQTSLLGRPLRGVSSSSCLTYLSSTMGYEKAMYTTIKNNKSCFILRENEGRRKIMNC